MNEITINDFKGVYQRASKFALPTVFAEECRNLLPTKSGMLVKRDGYTAAFNITGLTGNIINFFELRTNRPSPDDVKYLCQTDNSDGEIYLWGGTTWAKIDADLTDMRDAAGTVQKCVFMEEDGRVRVLVGNRSVNLPLWWGYCEEKFKYAMSSYVPAYTSIAAGFLSNMVAANISSVPTSTYLTATRYYEPDSANPWVSCLREDANDARYAYAVSFQYDSKQWSPLSSNTIHVDVGFGSGYGARVLLRLTIPDTVNKRITSVRIFRARSLYSMALSAEMGSWYLLKEFHVNHELKIDDGLNNNIWPLTTDTETGTLTTGTKTIELDNGEEDDFVQDGLYNNCILAIAANADWSDVTYRIISDTNYTDLNNQQFILADVTGLTDRSYYVKIMPTWYYTGGNYYLTFVDHVHQDIIAANPTSVDLGVPVEAQVETLCPRLGVIVNDLAIYGDVYHNKEQKSFMITYGSINDTGINSNDVHQILNAFSVKWPITGMTSIGDRLLIYSTQGILRGVLPTANELSWDFEESFNTFGLLAPNSLTQIGAYDYFISTDLDVKKFDGTISESIGSGIYDLLHANTTYTAASVGFFIPKMNMYVLKLQTAAATYEYWGFDITGQFGWVELDWYDDFNGSIINNSGDNYAFTNAGLYILSTDTDDNGTAISFYYKSNPIYLDQRFRHHLQRYLATYKSDSAVTLTLTDDEGNVTTITLAAKTSLGSKMENLPLGTNGKYFILEMAPAATNTSFEFHNLQLPGFTTLGEVV